MKTSSVPGLLRFPVELSTFEVEDSTMTFQHQQWLARGKHSPPDEVCETKQQPFQTHSFLSQHGTIRVYRSYNCSYTTSMFWSDMEWRHRMTIQDVSWRPIAHCSTSWRCHCHLWAQKVGNLGDMRPSRLFSGRLISTVPSSGTISDKYESSSSEKVMKR